MTPRIVSVRPRDDARRAVVLETFPDTEDGAQAAGEFWASLHGECDPEENIILLESSPSLEDWIETKRIEETPE